MSRGAGGTNTGDSFAVRLERELADSTQLEIGLMTPSSHSYEIKPSS